MAEYAFEFSYYFFQLVASFSPDKNKMYLREKLSSAQKNKILRMKDAVQEV